MSRAQQARQTVTGTVLSWVCTDAGLSQTFWVGTAHGGVVLTQLSPRDGVALKKNGIKPHITRYTVENGKMVEHTELL